MENRHEATKELAWNPLLLTLLCMVYDELRNFPRNREIFMKKHSTFFLKSGLLKKGFLKTHQ